MSGEDQFMTWATEADFRKVQQVCLDGISKVNWLNNITYSPTVTLAEAVELIKNNQDGGEHGIRQLIPMTSDYHDWMNLAFLITVAYNRDHNPQIFTILRKGSTIILGKIIVFINSSPAKIKTPSRVLS